MTEPNPNRIRGSLDGLCIGDALAMPVHWYYNRQALKDDYIEECHRNFFRNYAAGLAPHKCGCEEKHIGGLAGLIPLVLYYAAQPDKARKTTLAHLALTHPGAKMEAAGSLLIRLLINLLEGHSLQETLMQGLAAQDSPFLGYPLLKWLQDPDEKVIGRHFKRNPINQLNYTLESQPGHRYVSGNQPQSTVG